MRQLSFVEALPVRGFPSLVLEKNAEYWPIPVNYQDDRAMLELIAEIK